ncbi:MAG: glycosyltransferase family 39 protein [Chloroflexota bacterium]|nr:glycosyltransferase family 39 protein [Chloroflexota bacterium]
MPYWIASTLTALPIYLIALLAVGVPWAYALLAPADRRDRALLVGAAIVTGAALLTAWLFILGTLGAITGSALIGGQSIAIGAGVLAIAGVLAATITTRRAVPAAPDAIVRPADERLLIALIALAVVVAAIVTAYWPFTAYDTLWVYGYQARLVALTGNIPHTIDYYPPFMPLLYTLAQSALTGGIDDHAARAVVPILHVGAILAAYTLGRLLDGRRTGVYLAALWALYPHVGEWSRAGDLEIPLAMSFTLASAFFLRAWMTAGAPGARRDALIAGLAFGVALWTKPTAGAFAIGVGLMLAFAVVMAIGHGGGVRAAWRTLRPRATVAAITALACAPLGGVWYVRNLILGHSAVDFPPPFWGTLAERGGDEFGLPLLAIGLLVVALWLRYRGARQAVLAIGLALCIGAVARSLFVPDLTLDARRMTLLELAILFTGVVLIARGLVRFLRSDEAAPLRALAATLGWVTTLAIPYFAVWFWSYSYHYRLSFAVVPLLLLPTAVVLARVLRLDRLRALWRPLALVGIAALALPGILSPIADKFVGADYLFTDALPDDDARYRSGNAALMRIVDGLRIWQSEHPGDRLIVSAPGMVRLPFFFPSPDQADIRIDHPTRLAQIDDAGYFIYGVPEMAGGYADTPFFENQVIGVLGREDLVRRAWWLDDGIFSYDVYELHLDKRFARPTMNAVAGDDVLFGGFVRYLGHDLGGLDLWAGRPLVATLYFEVTAPAPADYSIFIHLRDNAGALIANWDDPVGRSPLGYHSSLMWEPGEFLTEIRTLRLPDGVAPLGSGYQFDIGLYDTTTQARVLVTVNGVAAGDSFTIEDRIAIIPPPAE